jgi:HrpA-like RNA helicase
VQQGAGDILIFMTGQEDIEATCCLIADRKKVYYQGSFPDINFFTNTFSKE